MTEFTGRDANVAITRFFGMHGATLSEKAFDAIADATADSDGLRAIITAIEALYQSRETLNEEGTALLGDLLTFAGGRNFYGYQSSGRAPELAAVAERIKDGRTARVKDDDPEIDTRFADPDPPLVPPAAEEAGGE